MINFNENITEIVNNLIAGKLSNKQLQEFEQWCKASEDNLELYKLTLLSIKTNKIKEGAKTFEGSTNAAYNRFEARISQASRISQTPPIIGKVKKYQFAKYAAAVVLAFVLGGIAGQIGDIIGKLEGSFSKNEELLTYKVEVPYGSKGKVQLPDGTFVWLNSGSTLSYDSNFGKGHRNVNLNGEGNFDVTKSATTPFIVNSDKITAKVYGTKFNFKSYEGDLLARVTLIEGSLSVASSLNRGDSTMLVPNQQAVLINSGQVTKDLLQVAEVNAIDYNEWTKESKQEVNEELLNLAEIAKKANIVMPTITPNNSILFDNEPMFQIIKDLERMYNVSIELTDKELLNRHFYGNFRNEESLYDIIDIIARTNNLSYKITDNTIKFYRK